jgi:hypothetical protein
VNIVNKHNRSIGVSVGLCLAACLLGDRAARAEVELAEKDGWTFSFDGRVNAFLSGGFGDGLPTPTGGNMHTVNGTEPGRVDSIPDVGWQPNYGQLDQNHNFTNIRVRSGMYGNILGFGISKRINETTTVKGYISIWSTVESLGEDKWAPISPIAREGYLTVTGDWGSAYVGRMLGWIGRMSWDIDSAYGHGFGVGLPCTDSLGPACGHIGTGALFPGYSAGIAYATPRLGGLKLNVGLYDPIIFSSAPTDWSRAALPRPEGALVFDRKLSESARIKFAVEGMWQQLTRNDATTMASINGSVWGVSGGVRVEAGPLRLGLSGFNGKGLGLFYALQNTHAIQDQTHEFRTFAGFYGQGGLEFGRVLVSGGFGMALVNQTADDKLNTMLSVIRYQRGISGAVYFHATDSIVIGLDYFNFAAGWWGAPVAGGGHLAGETQLINFVNAGVTYYW